MLGRGFESYSLRHFFLVCSGVLTRIYIPPVPDPNDQHEKHIVLNLIYDSVFSDTDPENVLTTRQLFHSGWPMCQGKGFYFRQDSRSNCFGEFIE